MLSALRKKHLETWLGGYALGLLRREPLHPGRKHLLFAFCDHYEPLWKKPGLSVGEQRVAAWSTGYPALARRFRDANGRHPRHSFFFPGEEYAPQFLDALADLARAGFGEVELHLHHDNDNAANLRRTITSYLTTFAQHGHLAREGERLRYAFIHGNWCLANARSDGRWCGVDEELPLLFDTGCYADFTFPAAPDQSQPNRINQIYWPQGELARRRAYEHGRRARVGHAHDDRILMIEGPLTLARRPRGFGIRIEAAALTAEDPASPSRVRSWVEQNIHVAGRPEWIFVKVHTHGAPERQAASLLGAGGEALHAELTTRYNDGVQWVLHYVTAREMYNIALAAMAGRDGDPSAYFDFRLPPPPAARA